MAVLLLSDQILIDRAITGVTLIKRKALLNLLNPSALLSPEELRSIFARQLEAVFFFFFFLYELCNSDNEMGMTFLDMQLWRVMSGHYPELSLSCSTQHEIVRPSETCLDY